MFKQREVEGREKTDTCTNTDAHLVDSGLQGSKKGLFLVCKACNCLLQVGQHLLGVKRMTLGRW